MGYETYNYKDANKKLFGSSVNYAMQGASLGTAISPGLGTAIGAGVGLLGGALLGNRANNLEEERILENNKAFAIEEKNNMYTLNRPKDSTVTPYYALGNNNGLPINLDELINQSNLIKTSLQGGKIVGSTHEQGGINTSTGQVEGGETIYNGMVFSNRLMKDNSSYAELSAELTKRKGKLEELFINESDELLKNKLSLDLKNIDSELNSLFQEQELASTTMQDVSNNMEVTNTPSTAPFGKTNEQYYEELNPDFTLGFDEFSNPIELNDDRKRTSVLTKGVATQYQTPTTIMNPNLVNELTADATQLAIGKSLQPSAIGINTDINIGNGVQNFDFTQPETEKPSLLKSTKDYISKNPDMLLAGTQLVGNLALNEINKSIDVPKPTLNDYVDLNTSYNIDDALAASARNASSTNKFIKENTRNSNVATGKMQTTQANKLQNENTMFATKSKVESELENQELMLNNTISQQNNMLIDDYNTSKYLKDINTNVTTPSQILADTYDRMNAININNKKDDFQQQQLDIVRQQYNEYGAADDMLLAVGDVSKVTTDNFDMLYQRSKNNPNPKVRENLEKWAKDNNIKL